MVSTAVPGGHLPRAVLRDAVDWGRVVVATAARAVVAGLLGLALWAAAPALIGWQPTTVMTGSMAPRLAPGDVVVSRPVPPDEVRPGRILLADDPDVSGHLRMHRFVEEGPGGSIVTKGDANPQADSTPLERSAVHGVAFLRIPFIAAPVTWLHDGDWVRLVLLGLGLAAVLALCTVDGSLRRLVDEPADPGDPPDDPGGDPSTGLEARGGPVTSLQADGSPPGTRRSPRGHGRRRRPQHRLRRLGGTAAVVLLTVGVGTLAPPSAVAAPFSRTTGSASNYGAGTPQAVLTLSCAPASSDSVTISWTYPTTPGIGEPYSFDLVSGGTQVATADGGATSLTYRGGGLLVVGTYDLRLRTNLGGTWTVLSPQTVRVRVLSVVGLGSAACA
ncbi:signal peptidase [Curtobacterium luteum]|uniref:Signal peptidase n=1 Tax=Curtobacterium luteum TaxID=33881 RepID=A0A8H9GC65_9MICO|nr:S24/S26 family peptidase [Curtobacterium luteum]MBM7803945.1 signal peptidase [Curtobacterium luteum]NUU49440.1 S24/S26 family peptidase [Curtobacterium luteum]GGL05199.1 hypothetical protein GCM10009769_24140 [Curtobacterium luteum]